MNRLKPNKPTVWAALLVLAIAVCGCGSYVGQSAAKSDKQARCTLAGLTLEQLGDQYRRDLFDDFLPFMNTFVIDHEYGGFMCNTDRNGRNLDTNKNAWYIGRGIWVYSFLYNNFGENPEHLKVTRKAVDFILASSPEEGRLWSAEFTRTGEPIPPRGQYIGNKFVPVGQQVYGDLFIAEGLTEYSIAVNDETYWNLAKDILLKCMDIYDRPDYAPTAPMVYLPDEDAGPVPGARLLGVWMLVVRLTSQMLEIRPDPEVLAISNRALDAIFTNHYNPEYDLLNEVLMHDMSRPQNEYRDLAYTGHAIETMWMVMYEARRRNDRQLFDKAAQLFKRTLEVAWDDVYGGFYRGLKNVHENRWILDKALWVQEEALIGLLFIIENTGEEWAKEWFTEVYSLVQDKYPLRKHGYALWDLWTDRYFTFVEDAKRVGNYHHPRHLMMNLKTLERIAERDCQIPDWFNAHGNIAR